MERIATAPAARYKRFGAGGLACTVGIRPAVSPMAGRKSGGARRRPTTGFASAPGGSPGAHAVVVTCVDARLFSKTIHRSRRHTLLACEG